MRIGGLYVHFPFCQKKCPYCDFVSFQKKPSYQYIEAIVKEFNLYEDLFSDISFDSIYLGGGTPSLIPAQWIEELLRLLQSYCIAKNPEITIEVNPESLTEEHCKTFFNIGINRVSIGVQSFDDQVLELSGRLHRSRTALNAIFKVYQAGIHNISIDLIAGLPGENKKTWEINLSHIINLPLKHISTYFLDIPQKTPFFRLLQEQQLFLPSESAVISEYALWILELKRLSYVHYEISNFSLPGFESRHNLHYWRGDDFLGLGVSAYSSLFSVRHQNTIQLGRYFKRIAQKKNARIWTEALNNKKLHREKIMLGLRLLQEGIDYESLDKKQKITAKHWISKNHMILKNKRLLLNETGVFLANQIILSLI